MDLAEKAKYSTDLGLYHGLFGHRSMHHDYYDDFMSFVEKKQGIQVDLPTL